MNACDQWLSQFYGKLPREDYSLLERAARTLLGNILIPAEGKRLPWAPWRGITPSHVGFRGVWNWDSAFHAVGVSRWDAALAREQILMFLERQQPSGLLPDVVFEDGRIADNFGKPPVMPWAALTIDRRAPDDAFLQEVYPKFVLYESHWRQNRGGDRHGLFNYDAVDADPAKRLTDAKYESGWDNSVRWDGGIYEVWPVDLNCFMVMLYQALAQMAGRLRLPQDAGRWEKAGAELAQRIETRLWDAATGAYRDFDFGKGAFVDALSPASFMPLYVRIADKPHAEAMARLAASPKKFTPGWPSVAYDDRRFDPTGYWRGRTWLNVAYFALKGLKDYGFDEVADAGRDTLLAWVRNTPGHIHENYHPLTGAPLGAADFSWSAVFTIEFLLNWTPGRSL
ncbi:MAG: trehalase family glycosidase [Lentisphaeria bacterium]